MAEHDFAVRTAGETRDYERLSLGAFAFLALFAIVAFLGPVLSDGDSWWHLAAGRWIVENGAIPHTDPFSHTMPGKAWHAHEWLSEVLMWGAYSLAGWGGLLALAALIAGTATAMLAMAARRWLAPVPAIILTVAAIMCLLPSALIRPHLMVLPIFIGWLIALLDARERGTRPPLALVLLMTLWANMHGSFLLGLVLIGPFALEALIEGKDKKRVVIDWGLFGLLATAAALVTPFGINGFIYPIEVAQMETLHEIVEWRHTTFSNSVVLYPVLFAAFAAFLLLGVKFPLARALVFLLVLFLAFKSVRHVFVFGFVGALMAAAPLGAALKPRPSGAASNTKLDRIVFFALLGVGAVALAARLILPANLDDLHELPVQAISKVPPELRRQPVFNDYSAGGPLIFFGVKAFIDGRADMYGDAHVREFLAAERGDPAELDRVFRKYGIRWTLLGPKTGAVKELDQRGWKRLHTDKHAVIHMAPAVDKRTSR